MCSTRWTNSAFTPSILILSCLRSCVFSSPSKWYKCRILCTFSCHVAVTFAKSLSWRTTPCCLWVTELKKKTVAIWVTSSPPLIIHRTFHLRLYLSLIQMCHEYLELLSFLYDFRPASICGEPSLSPDCSPESGRHLSCTAAADPTHFTALCEAIKSNLCTLFKTNLNVRWAGNLRKEIRCLYRNLPYGDPGSHHLIFFSQLTFSNLAPYI